MRFKLSYKLFVVFLLMNITSVSILIITNRYFTTWNFDYYIRFRVREKLSILGETLSSEYQKHNGWHFLGQSPAEWVSLVYLAWPLENPEETVRHSDDDISPRPVIVIDTDESNSKGHEGGSPLPDAAYDITLFNHQKKAIAGADCSFDELEVQKIKVNGKTVGWLGIKFGPLSAHPKDRDLIRKQSVTFNAVGGITLLLSTIVIFVFSKKQLLSPIQQLSNAMKALKERKFDVRIPLEKNDELGILAERFNSMAKQLHDYDRNQKQWLSDISHELRTPLSILIGEIEAFQDGVLCLDKTSLGALGDEAKYLRRIVEDLHFISLTESNSISMEKHPVKPVMILTQVIYHFENRLKQRGISLNVCLQTKAADLEITGDEVRLKQVFSNLIENALQHMDKPGTLSIRQNQVTNRLIITFEDSGPGVPEHALPHLFERLYKADLSRNRKSGGSGLGLAICETIINGHGGKIIAENAESGGLAINISLPISTNHLG